MLAIAHRIQVFSQASRATVARVVTRLNARRARRDLIAGPQHLLDTALLHGLRVCIISSGVALHTLADIVQLALVALPAGVARAAREGDIFVDHLRALVAEQLAD